MAVISVERMWSKFGSEANPTTINIFDSYQVVHDVNTPLLDIYNASGIPALGSPHPEFPSANVFSAAPAQVSPIMTILTVQYQGNLDTDAGDLGNSGPTSIVWSSSPSEEETDQAFGVSGAPIVTFTGEPIEGVRTRIVDQVATITRKFISFSPWLSHAYLHSVNSDTYLSYPPGTGKLMDYSATATGGGQWEVTATINFRYPWRTTSDKSWYARVRSEGYMEIVPGLGKVHAVDALGQPVSRPVLLKKADGTRITDPDDAEWYEIQLYDSLPYSALGLI